MTCVLDASVALSWLLEDAAAGQSYAVTALHALGEPGGRAVVPAIWGLELANTIVRAELGSRLTMERTALFLRTLAVLPIQVDSLTAAQALPETLPLARHYRLSSYDAAYLELAQRLSLPLATLDDGLRRAARKAGVKIFKP